MNTADFHERVLKHKVTKYGKWFGVYDKWFQKVYRYWYQCEEGCNFDAE